MSGSRLFVHHLRGFLDASSATLRASLSLLLLVACSHPLASQDKLLPVLHFNHLTTADGLPTNNIFGVVRDSKGFVWIGTGNGLSRYDGYGFKTYRNVLNDSSSIASSMIMVVKEDSKHRLWVGTWDAGLSLYDPRRDRFINFTPRPGDSSWIQVRSVFSILEDSAGVLWLGTSNGDGGIVRVDLPETRDGGDIESVARGIRFKTYRLGTPRIGAIDLRMHSDGKILVASDRGLLLFDRRTGVVSRPGFPGPPGQRLNNAVVRRIVEDHFANLWLATSEGLFKIDWKDGEVYHFRHSDSDNLSIARDNLQDGALDWRGNIWLASSEGVDMVSPATGKRIPYLTFGSRPVGNASMMLQVDQTGTLWISTGGGGLYWLSEKSLRFPHYSHGQLGASAWGFETIERTRNGELWLCSYGWVNQLDVSTRTIVKSIDVLRGATPTYWDSNSRTSFLDAHGILWYGIWGPGLFKVDLATEQVKRFQYPDQRHAGDAAVRSIAPGTGDSLWIAAAHDGLWKFDPASGRFERGSTTSFARANDVMKDRNGKLWIATILDGLYVLDPHNGAIEHFVHDPSNPNSLSNDRTNSLYEDPAGRIWFGAVNVLNYWNSATRTFVRFPNPAFPEANATRVVGSDRKGRLWVSYGGGQLARFDASAGLFQNFDASDGVCGYVIDMQNLDDGRVLLSGSSGLNMFDPDSVSHVHRAAPPLVITRLSINDSSVVPPSIADQAGALTLSSDQNVIELEFAALDIDAPKLVEYRYRLEGLEQEWVEPRGRRYVRYPGLRPGEYEFRVRATSSRGEWPDREIALAFSIAPPWWQTWWAYGAYVMVLLALVAAAYQLRLKQLRLKQEVQMERFQAERVAEVDRLKSRFFANVSHEFRTPLTLILGPAEQAIESTQEPSTLQKLKLIKNNTERLHGLVNQLLDLSRLESGAMKLQVSRNDVVEFLRRTVMSFESWAERKKIDLTFRAEMDSYGGFFDTDKLTKILNNLMSNALKFTPEGGSITVSVQIVNGRTRAAKNSLRAGHGSGDPGHRDIPETSFLSQKGAPGNEGNSAGSLDVTVSDTGPGIPAEHLPRIFDRFYRADETHTNEGTGIGLALTKELVELHHGSITAQSRPGQGSVFTVILPIEEDAYRRDEIIEAPFKGEKPLRPSIPLTHTGAGDTSPSKPIDGKPIVLIVEDNPDLRSYIREFLETDYAVQEANDGKEGYDRAIEMVPDIVISDLMMPEMDGLELCRALKQDVRTSHVPVILLTARAGTESKVEGLETGADDYVTKPFDSKELMARVRNLIEQRRQLRAKFSAGVVLKPGEVAVTSLDDAFLKKVMDIVERCMGDEDFGAEEIAREVALSRRHLDRKLMGLTNLSAAEFIRYMRLQRAHELLEKNSATVAETAFQVGFGSPSYFTSCFRERFGCLPSEMHRKSS
ncbi:MAG: Signal transduction histidine kinase [Bacteroidetes bacterium]|nr:Signal transduction histidine kinase [Bacteroidota bacterium]